MKNISLVKVPAPVLYEKAEDVSDINGQLIDQIKGMFYIMSTHGGRGLASNQVGILNRVIVMSPFSITSSKEQVFINPVIIESSQKKRRWVTEGCLSIPDYYNAVTRSGWVRLRSINLKGNFCETSFWGINAIIAQHEMDHLNGVLIKKPSTPSYNKSAI